MGEKGTVGTRNEGKERAKNYTHARAYNLLSPSLFLSNCSNNLYTFPTLSRIYLLLTVPSLVLFLLGVSLNVFNSNGSSNKAIIYIHHHSHSLSRALSFVYTTAKHSAIREVCWSTRKSKAKVSPSSTFAPLIFPFSHTWPLWRREGHGEKGDNRRASSTVKENRWKRYKGKTETTQQRSAIPDGISQHRKDRGNVETRSIGVKASGEWRLRCLSQSEREGDTIGCTC